MASVGSLLCGGTERRAGFNLPCRCRSVMGVGAAVNITWLWTVVKDIVLSADSIRWPGVYGGCLRVISWIM
jgi:hypothetical protein